MSQCLYDKKDCNIPKVENYKPKSYTFLYGVNPLDYLGAAYLQKILAHYSYVEGGFKLEKEHYNKFEEEQKFIGQDSVEVKHKIIQSNYEASDVKIIEIPSKLVAVILKLTL